MIEDIKNALALDWCAIYSFETNGVRYFKAVDVCDQFSLSNPSVAVEKVSVENKRRFLTGEVDGVPEPIPVRPWFVTEEGLLQLLMLNNTPETQAVKERVVYQVLTRVARLRH